MNDSVWDVDRFKKLLDAASVSARKHKIWFNYAAIGISDEDYGRCCGYRSGRPSLLAATRVASFCAVPLDYLTGRCSEEDAERLLKDYAANIDLIRAPF